MLARLVIGGVNGGELRQEPIDVPLSGHPLLVHHDHLRDERRNADGHRVGDAEGSVVLRMTGGYDGSVARSEWEVVDGSGTGALAGMRGAGISEATSDGTPVYRLDYDLR